MDIIPPKKTASAPENPSPKYLGLEQGFSERGDLPKYIPSLEQPQIKQPHAAARPTKRRIGLLFLFLIFILVGILGSGLFLLWKTHRLTNNIRLTNERQTNLFDDTRALTASIMPSTDQRALRGEEEGRINILLLGAAGKGKPGQNLTDTIMLMSLDTKQGKMGLLSLPRDLYTKVPDMDYYGKINSLFQFGLNQNMGADLIRKAVENVTGQKISYYLIVDFDGFTKIIDDIGGINVNVERDLYDTRYPGPNYSYETFEIKKGLQKLDGATALKYARERHADPDGDFGRAKRQQQIIQATKNKMFSLGTILNISKISNILDTLGENIKTDIPLEDWEGFIRIIKQTDTQNISTTVVDAWEKNSLLRVSHVQSGNIRAFVLVPKAGNFSEIQELAQNIFDLNTVKKRNEQIAQEAASIVLINQSGDSTLPSKIKRFLEENFQTEKIIIQNTPTRATTDKTKVVDNTAGKKLITLDELIKKIPATLSGDPVLFEKDFSNADFVLILGQDAAKAHSFSEDSLDNFKQQDESDQQEMFLIENK